MPNSPRCGVFMNQLSLRSHAVFSRAPGRHPNPRITPLQDLLTEARNEMPAAEIDPDDFIRFTYARALAHRQPRYEAMSRWGITLTIDQVAALETPQDFDEMIAQSLPASP